MRYQGGKSRIARNISKIINAYTVGRPFVSLFCGSCSIESKIQNYSYMICNDKHKYLIALLRGVQGGFVPPDSVTVEEYRYIRAHLDENPALSGFVGFGCSFGGKWFGGYARENGDTNYALQSKKSLLRDMSTLGGAWFINLDYRCVAIPQGAVVYADPPYANTTQYGNEPFDSADFWNYMRLIAQTGHTVFISEQRAPETDFVCIWERAFTRTLDRNKSNQFRVSERLFTYGGAL